MDIIWQDPWLTVGDLLERSGYRWGTLHYHLTVLLKEGSIRTVRDGRRRLIVPNGAKLDERGPADSLLRGKTAREIAHLVCTRPCGSIEDLCNLVDKSPRVVYYHVKRFIEAGLIESSSATRHRHLQPTPALVKALQRRDASLAQDRARREEPMVNLRG